MSENSVMKIITRQLLANGAAKRYRAQYSGGQYGDKSKTTEKLLALNSPVDPDEVDRIIGNTSWTTPPSCNVCGKLNGPVVEVGDKPDYDSNTAWVCFDCVRAIGKMVNAFEGELHEDDRRS